jgi:hypothetical protein
MTNYGAEVDGSPSAGQQQSADITVESLWFTALNMKHPRNITAARVPTKQQRRQETIWA